MGAAQVGLATQPPSVDAVLNFAARPADEQGIYYYLQGVDRPVGVSSFTNYERVPKQATVTVIAAGGFTVLSPQFVPDLLTGADCRTFARYHKIALPCTRMASPWLT